MQLPVNIGPMVYGEIFRRMLGSLLVTTQISRNDGRAARKRTGAASFFNDKFGSMPLANPSIVTKALAINKSPEGTGIECFEATFSDSSINI